VACFVNFVSQIGFSLIISEYIDVLSAEFYNEVVFWHIASFPAKELFLMM
jgi:predicted cobalt transporter CbtA